MKQTHTLDGYTVKCGEVSQTYLDFLEARYVATHEQDKMGNDLFHFFLYQDLFEFLIDCSSELREFLMYGVECNCGDD